MQAHFLIQRRIRPADVQAARRHFEVVRRDDLQRQWIHVDRRGGFHGFGDGLEADPATGIARHRKTNEAHVEDVLHAGRVEHRHQRGLEFAFAAVGQGGAAAGVIVGRQRQHAAEPGGAGGVGVLEHVAAAVHARTLAVPHAEYAIDLGAREEIGLLGAPDHGRAEIFVQAGGELHPGGRQMLLRAPQLQIEAAQRAAAVAADEARGIQPGGLIAQPLHQRQADQTLHTRQVDPAFGPREFIVQRVVAVDAGRNDGGRQAEVGGVGHEVWRPGDAGARRHPLLGGEACAEAKAF